MTQSNFENILEQLKQYIHNAGIELTTKFSNGYEVSELVAEVGRLNDAIGGNIIPENYVFTSSEEGQMEAIAKNLAAGSQEQIFLASAAVVDKISSFEEYKKAKSEPQFGLFCESNDDLGLQTPEEACASTPFLAKACEYLTTLQSEVGPIPECAGEYSSIHTEL